MEAFVCICQMQEAVYLDGMLFRNAYVVRVACRCIFERIACACICVRVACTCIFVRSISLSLLSFECCGFLYPVCCMVSKVISGLVVPVLEILPRYPL